MKREGVMIVRVSGQDVTVIAPKGIARARCRKTDEFSLLTGIEICLKRIDRRYKQAYGYRKPRA